MAGGHTFSGDNPTHLWEMSDADEDLGFESLTLFDHFFMSSRPMFSLSGRIWNPPVNVSETPDGILVRMEIAGIRPSDLSVTVEQGVLVLRGHRYEPAPAEQEEFHLMEIRHGGFERAFRLSSNIAEDGIKAYYQNGFLEIEIPKGTAKGNSVRVPIRIG